MEKTNNKSKN